MQLLERSQQAREAQALLQREAHATRRAQNEERKEEAKQAPQVATEPPRARLGIPPPFEVPAPAADDAGSQPPERDFFDMTRRTNRHNLTQPRQEPVEEEKEWPEDALPQIDTSQPAMRNSVDALPRVDEPDIPPFLAEQSFPMGDNIDVGMQAAADPVAPQQTVEEQ